jgi:hypothetical protein
MCPMMATENRASPHSFFETKRHGCTWLKPIRSSNLHARGAQWRSPAEPSGTRHFGQINNGMHQTDLHLGARETLGPPPLFDRPTNSGGGVGHHHHARDCSPRCPRASEWTQKPPRAVFDDAPDATGAKRPRHNHAHLD